MTEEKIESTERNPFKMFGRTLPKYMDEFQAKHYFESLCGLDWFDMAEIARGAFKGKTDDRVKICDLANSDRVVKTVANSLKSLQKRLGELYDELEAEYDEAVEKFGRDQKDDEEE